MKLSVAHIKNTVAENSKKGFTLIELLVVIGILGILAAALVATIDPFEQLNKAQDSNSKNTAVEFLNANIRYYTNHQALPWYTNGANCLGGTTTLSAVNLTVMDIDCLTTLIAEGELKPGFTTATGILGTLYANETGGNITMCYLPKSKSQKRDANTRFQADGQPHATYTGGPNNPTNANSDVYWCTQ